jgi:hypothetical protein
VELVPLSQREARAFIREHHRHSNPDRGDIIRVALAENGQVVAVGVAGRPKAAGLQDGRTLEITRICTTGQKNACTRLYGALCRAGAALGYLRAYTYTLESEPGTSPAAAGFVRDAEVAARNWATQSGRDRYESNLFGETVTPDEPKIRWLREL